MGKLERITVTMPEEMAAKLRAAVDAGEYATTSEVVREALREWADHQARREASIARLEALVEEARKGPFVDGRSAMSEFRSQLAAKVTEGG